MGVIIGLAFVYMFFQIARFTLGLGKAGVKAGHKAIEWGEKK